MVNDPLPCCRIRHRTGIRSRSGSGPRRPSALACYIDAVDQRRIYVGHNCASNEALARLGVSKDGFEREAHQPQSADQQDTGHSLQDFPTFRIAICHIRNSRPEY
jgi:hypothetical protein